MTSLLWRHAGSLQGGQHVGPSVGPIARLKQENRDLKADVTRALAEVERLRKEVFDYRDGFMEASTELENLRELQKAAEAVEGPVRFFHLDIRPQIRALHKAIRKVRGMQ